MARSVVQPVMDPLPMRPWGAHVNNLRMTIVQLDVAAAMTGVVVAGGRAPSTLAAAALTMVTANRMQGLHRTFTSSMRVFTYSALVRSAVCVGFVLHAVRSSSGPNPTALSSVAMAIGALIMTAVSRSAFEHWLGERRRAGAFRRRTVVIGEGAEAARVVRLLQDHPALGHEVVGVLGDHPVALGGGVSWLGGRRDAAMTIPEVQATGAVIASAGMSGDAVSELVRILESLGVHVHVSSGVQGIDCRRLHAVDVGHQPFLYLAPPSLAWWQVATKRIVDITLSAIGLVVAAPVLLVAAVAIKLDDRGPVLFRQERAGRDGRPFRVHKLRTMQVGAERKLADLRDRNERDGPLFKLRDDPRVTRVGQFLRSSSIDELPQLFDVLIGRMSLVGPRPALPDEVAQFDAELRGRLAVKPGVTGLWQVEGRDDPDFGTYRRLDLFYVENWSVLLDLLILLDTVPAVIGRTIGAVLHSPVVARPVPVDDPVAPAVPEALSRSAEPQEALT